jgi:flagellar basal body rod protein FlgG
VKYYILLRRLLITMGMKYKLRVYMSNNADILQGYIENSNVDIAKEMSRYDYNSKSFSITQSGALKTR